MAKIEKSIFVAAPVEKVFSFMADPNNILDIWPSLLEVKNVQPLPNGGHCYDWAYKMAGMRFEGHSETIEVIKDQRVVVKNESGLPSTFVWTYLPDQGGTRVTVSTEYSIPGVMLSKLAEPVILKMNEHEGETLLANLKALMEA